MAAPPPRNFRGLLATLPDPYADNIGGFVGAFAVGGPTPQVCFAQMRVNGYPSFYLGTDTAGRLIVVGAPFSTDMPGRADNTGNNWAFCGDLSPTGTMCPLVEVSSQHFHLTQNVFVPDDDHLLATWNALDPNETHLPPQAGQPNTVEIRTRKLIPIPHQLVAEILAHFCQGTLTHRNLNIIFRFVPLLDGALVLLILS